MPPKYAPLSPGRERRSHYCLLGDGGAVELGDDPAAAHNKHAVRETEDFLELRGDQEHAHAVLCEVGEQFVDCALGTDVDPLCRLVCDEHFRAAEEPLREEN